MDEAVAPHGHTEHGFLEQVATAASRRDSCVLDLIPHLLGQ
jgi:hypothetical protein